MVHKIYFEGTIFLLNIKEIIIIEGGGCQVLFEFTLYFIDQLTIIFCLFLVR